MIVVTMRAWRVCDSDVVQAFRARFFFAVRLARTRRT
jgi:hypothetical protein